MAIYRQDDFDDNFENLVIVDNGSENEAYIIKYFPSFEYLQNLESHIHKLFSGEINIQSLDYNQLKGSNKAISCYTYTQAFCGHGDVGTAAGPGCYRNADGGAHVFTKTITVCIDAAGNPTIIGPDIPDTGGGIGGGGNTNPNPPPIVTEPVIIIVGESQFLEGLSPEHKLWWKITADINTKKQIVKYWRENGNDWVFSEWSIDYLKRNPSVTIEQFKNWFMTPREGKDWDYDAQFWENPNLNFPEQDLPSWEDFEDAFPTSSGSELVETVGGEVKQAYNQYPSLSRGYCALKVSRALNYSGITIPQITTTRGKPGTVQGVDGKYYFLNAKALNAWMRETFGTNPENPNHRHFTSQQGGTNGENFPTLVAGLKGIYSMVSTDSNWASGHADIIENQICLSGCHLSDSPPAPIDYIDIWILE